MDPERRPGAVNKEGTSEISNRKEVVQRKRQEDYISSKNKMITPLIKKRSSLEYYKMFCIL